MLLQHRDLNPGTGEQQAQHEARRTPTDDATGRPSRTHHAMNYALQPPRQSRRGPHRDRPPCCAARQADGLRHRHVTLTEAGGALVAYLQQPATRARTTTTRTYTPEALSARSNIVSVDDDGGRARICSGRNAARVLRPPLNAHAELIAEDLIEAVARSLAGRSSRDLTAGQDGTLPDVTALSIAIAQAEAISSENGCSGAARGTAEVSGRAEPARSFDA